MFDSLLALDRSKINVFCVCLLFDELFWPGWCRADISVVLNEVASELSQRAKKAFIEVQRVS